MPGSERWDAAYIGAAAVGGGERVEGRERQWLQDDVVGSGIRAPRYGCK